MIIARNILFICLALLLQASWIDIFAIYGIAPDIVIIILVFIAFTRGQIEATALGFISGLLIDIYDPGSRLGTNALANSLIGFFAGYSRGGIAAETLRAQATILFLATLLHDIIFFSRYFATHQNFEHWIGNKPLHCCAGHSIGVCPHLFLTSQY